MPSNALLSGLETRVNAEERPDVAERHGDGVSALLVERPRAGI
jgi:hypothetical protein